MTPNSDELNLNWILRIFVSDIYYTLLRLYQIRKVCVYVSNDCSPTASAFWDSLTAITLPAAFPSVGVLLPLLVWNYKKYVKLYCVNCSLLLMC